MDDAAGHVALAAAVIWGAYVVAIVLRGRAAIAAARTFRREQEERDPYAIARDVTLLQPILSGDRELEATLRENVQALPANVRFVWLVDEHDEEGRRVAEKLRNEVLSAGVDERRILIETCPPTSLEENPKSAKLERGLAMTTTTCVGVLDDDTTVPPTGLASALAELDVFDLATGLPVYSQGQTFWSALVADFVNDNACTTYLPLLRLFPPLSINGMFYVTRTETLRSLGGFAAIRDRLCDDYAVACLYRDAGKTLRQTVDPQSVGTAVASAGAYVGLLHRWNRFADQLVRDQPLPVQALLFATLALPPLLLWAAIVSGITATVLESTGWFWLVPALLLATCSVRALLHATVHRRIVPSLPPQRPLRSLFVELLQPVHLLHALVRPTIVWRGRRIKTSRDGRFRQIDGGRR
ncbi:MAG TPA: glycosyltransferase [Pirellulaceae bacterium]|jgi:ceramide glucosyltransferase|nr:glycosyltransferase [Pirellulaceae bacterium]